MFILIAVSLFLFADSLFLFALRPLFAVPHYLFAPFTVLFAVSLYLIAPFTVLFALSTLTTLILNFL
ncbi:hypothetical protein CN692_24715 [Bacillus sp. AFS002410]|nr:hypothetical protein CN692_24715 [Bacillus sp. AFS002410]